MRLTLVLSFVAVSAVGALTTVVGVIALVTTSRRDA